MQENKKLEIAKNKILSIIKNSKVAEDYSHAINTLFRVKKIYKNPPSFLEIAALAHDIDRAVDYKIKRQDYNNYDEFKKAHSINSAKITKKILEELNFDKEFINKVTKIITLHEVGGTFYSDILKNADSISFFDNNLIHYFKREGYKNTYFRIKWGLKRMDKKYIKYLKSISNPNRTILSYFYNFNLNSQLFYSKTPSPIHQFSHTKA